MKIYLLTPATLFILVLFGLTSCQKGINGPGDKTKVDSTITDTTQFIDFTLNGERIFEISSTTADSTSNWKWHPLLFFWGVAYPDTTYYPLSSLKGGLMNTDNFNIPAFYFLKNSYGLSLEPYAASKRWWTPLIQKSFIDNFFRAGSYDYAVSTSEDTIYMFSPFSDPSPRKLLSTGIQLAWVDSKGKIWETSKGTSDQTNSFFTITKNVSTSFTFEPGYSDYAVSTLVTACFQCNLYDDAGNVIHLTNGRFRLELQFEQDYY